MTTNPAHSEDGKVSDARRIAESIVWKYSCPKMIETHCSAQDLIRDIESVVKAIMRERDQSMQIHENWLMLQHKYDEPKRRFWR